MVVCITVAVILGKSVQENYQTRKETFTRDPAGRGWYEFTEDDRI